MKRTLSRRVALGLLAAPAVARADATEVDAALVLAVDCSASIDAAEYRLQRDGYARAFADPRLARAIEGGRNGAIAVALLQWAGPNEQVVATRWRRLDGGAAARGYGRVLAEMPRAVNADATALGAAIETSRYLLRQCPWPALRRVIDVSGDGINNAGMVPERARDAAVAEGLVVNGLPLLTEVIWLDDYYRDLVIGGPDAFVVAVPDHGVFARAVLAKLLREIARTEGDLRAA